MIYVYQDSKNSKCLINNIFTEHKKIICKKKQDNKEILSQVQESGLFVFHADRTFDNLYYENKQLLSNELKKLNIRTVNSQLNNISKRYIQKCCELSNINNVMASRLGDKEEILIVKTDLNSRGIPENKNRETAFEYLVAPRKNIPEQYWADDTFVIEKFIENKNNIFYRVYKIFTKLVISEVTDDNLIKKMPASIKRINYFIDLKDNYTNHIFYEMIHQIDKLSESMFIDFAAFDIVVSDTKEFYIIDVNKTPCWGETQNNDLPIMRFLASCLET